MVSESIIANHAIISKFVGKKCTNHEIDENITPRKLPSIRYVVYQYTVSFLTIIIIHR